MFSDIFPDNQNRFVYKGGPEGPKLTQIYIGGKEKADALLNINKDPEAAKAHLNKDIDRMLDEIINAGKDNIKAKGAKLLNKEELRIVKSLRKVKKELQNKDMKVLDIYNVKTQINGALLIYNAISKGDPLRGALAVQEAKMPELQRKVPKGLATKKESIEATKWAKLSDNVKEYRKLGKTPNDTKRKATLRKEVKSLAATLIGNKRVVENKDIIIRKRQGYQKYRVTVKMSDRILEQGGKPGARKAGYTEFMDV